MTRSSPPRWLAWAAVVTAAFVLAAALPAGALAAKTTITKTAVTPATPKLPVEEHFLANGMKLVLIPQHLSPTVSGAWVGHVGSANERPGITGISHLFEHMMFKGTHRIGVRDDAKDAALVEEQERLQDGMRAELSKMRAAQRRGELEDIAKPEAKTARYKELEARFDSLVVEQRANMVKNEFNLVLQNNGATFINAFTNEDMTVYFETVPANKLELWFWMEADRLQNRVFREFYSERDVVYEERRRSYESTPTGQYEVSFDATFWDASPYQWPVIGWPSDVAAISKAQADEYYSLYYAPQNLTAVLVGDFDPKQALALAEKYLGAIPRGPKPAPEMITTETKGLAEKRFYAEAETNPAVWVRWHTPAVVHRDTPVLEIISELLNGPTGRLHKNLVLGAGVATSAGARSETRKYEGLFQVQAECKEGHSPDEVERALHAEIEKLQKEPVGAEEMQKVKNHYLASAYRQIGSNMQLLLRYAVAEGLATWRDADRLDEAVQAVTPADVQRVAQKYFQKENRAVAVWTRKGGGEPEDPAIANLPPEAKGMVKGMVARIAATDDPARLQQMLDGMDRMSSQMPPEMKPALEYIKGKAQAKLTQLQGSK
jgi:predicted Zn-dependent peptidase